MKIIISSGNGTGETTLAAFDNALKEAGIYNYNLIRLSSIIPPDSELVEKKFESPENEYGNKLYVVLAEERTDQLGRSIAAGIAWYQWDDKRGVFAEHHDIVETLEADEAERNVSKKLEATIKDLCEFREIKFEREKIHMKISSQEVNQKSACSLVAAVYSSEPW
ncbi:MAG: pyruvoyl-dependent arginine decarboxylase [bacterium]|nr:pyruvoyl-dependent arginine decarboxylase [bacterium]